MLICTPCSGSKSATCIPTSIICVSAFIKMKAIQPHLIWKAQTAQNHYKGRGTVTHVSRRENKSQGR